MVARPNGLVLKIFLNTGQIQNMFQIWAKNKKILQAWARYPVAPPRSPQTTFIFSKLARSKQTTSRADQLLA
jgi:hypothetical protein